MSTRDLITADLLNDNWARIAAMLQAHHVHGGTIDLCEFYYRLGFEDGSQLAIDVDIAMTPDLFAADAERKDWEGTPKQALGVFAQFASNVDPEEWEAKP